MFDFLFEGGLFLYLLLLIVLVLLFSQWRQRPQRRYLVWMGVVVGLAVLFFVLDRIRDTDQERAYKTLDEIIVLINQGEYDKAFSFLADDFSAYHIDRKAMREKAEKALHQYGIRNIRLKSLQLLKEEPEKRLVTIRFNATADNNVSSGWGMAPCEVDFVIDSQKRCRVKSFRVYRPIQSDELFDPFN
jgi:hypothetical protein